MGNTLWRSQPANEEAVPTKRVVIVGASFAGLFLTKKLIKLLSATAESVGRVEIVLVDKNEYFENTCSIPYAL